MRGNKCSDCGEHRTQPNQAQRRGHQQYQKTDPERRGQNTDHIEGYGRQERDGGNEGIHCATLFAISIGKHAAEPDSEQTAEEHQPSVAKERVQQSQMKTAYQE